MSSCIETARGCEVMLVWKVYSWVFMRNLQTQWNHSSKTQLTFTTVDVKLGNHPSDKRNLLFSGKCQEANVILVWTELKERPLCVLTVTNGFQSKRHCLPTPASPNLFCRLSNLWPPFYLSLVIMGNDHELLTVLKGR